MNEFTQGLAFSDIRTERMRQDNKFGDQSGHSALMWNAILGEEVGEVANAILEHASRGHLKDELTQVAAVCVAWLEVLYQLDIEGER